MNLRDSNQDPLPYDASPQLKEANEIEPDSEKIYNFSGMQQELQILKLENEINIGKYQS